MRKGLTFFGEHLRGQRERIRRRFLLLTTPRKSRFKVELQVANVLFCTEDPHSRLWFHSRYRDGDLHEPPVSRELIRRVATAAVFVDVGGHIGYFSCLAAAVNPNVKVFCFEMNRNLVPLIERNCTENRLSNVEVLNCAVAEQKKVVSCRADSFSPGLRMSHVQTAGGNGRNQWQVETITLDDFFHERGLGPNIIKIDVEGAEMNVLSGSSEILAQCHPTLFLEIHPNLVTKFGAPVDDVLTLLRQHRYDIYALGSHRTYEDLQPLRSQDQIRSNSMLLCT